MRNISIFIIIYIYMFFIFFWPCAFLFFCRILRNVLYLRLVAQKGASRTQQCKVSLFTTDAVGDDDGEEEDDDLDDDDHNENDKCGATLVC